ncbi:hypothetical protein [Sphingobacterium paludis]|uniref:Uncharacterized protein n=1 Tax=Sphingobacterium paludis TaxID=1476465 RepID=A0A4R7CS97_9SPHI|nr:hypothetical protein [Sphingobacterium paludis]TDS07507.1 hypothetical protein B0I21_11453 [Sphingobacterium paludis]
MIKLAVLTLLISMGYSASAQVSPNLITSNQTANAMVEEYCTLSLKYGLRSTRFKILVELGNSDVDDTETPSYYITNSKGEERLFTTIATPLSIMAKEGWTYVTKHVGKTGSVYTLVLKRAVPAARE